jgi:selenocysteine-specific elongation factor
MREFARNPYSPPSLKESQNTAGEEIVNALLDSGALVAVSPDVIFRKADYDQMAEGIRSELEQRGRISLAEVRDLYGTSRKYAQAVLEQLDAAGMTVREGDYRKLRK